MKRIFILFPIISTLLSAQKIQVVDAENNNPIGNARIILENRVVYTNDDGFAPVESTEKNLEVSAAGFTKQNLNAFTALVKLKPSFKDIEEVKIVSVNIKNLFEDVFKNYQKRYYEEPSLYDVVIKQKSLDNGKIHFMVISEAKLWSKTNWYNYKDGYNKRYDDILQLQLNNIKYLKRTDSDSVFFAQVGGLRHETMGQYYFNFELDRMLQSLKLAKSKYSGTLISEEGDEQLISFKMKIENGLSLTGTVRYNKIDKVITFFEVNYDLDEIATRKLIATDGREFSIKGGQATITYDFYKKDGVYLPALTRTSGDNYTYFYNNETHVKSWMREIVYNNFSKSDKKGLDPKVDFTKNIWENIPVKEDKETTILLSKEEQEFINQK